MVIRKFWKAGERAGEQYRVRYAISAYFIDYKPPKAKKWDYNCTQMMYLDRAQALAEADTLAKRAGLLEG
jgi:hypothetical protein